MNGAIVLSSVTIDRGIATAAEGSVAVSGDGSVTCHTSATLEIEPKAFLLLPGGDPVKLTVALKDPNSNLRMNAPPGAMAGEIICIVGKDLEEYRENVSFPTRNVPAIFGLRRAASEDETPRLVVVVNTATNITLSGAPWSSTGPATVVTVNGITCVQQPQLAAPFSGRKELTCTTPSYSSACNDSRGGACGFAGLVLTEGEGAEAESFTTLNQIMYARQCQEYSDFLLCPQSDHCKCNSPTAAFAGINPY